MTKQNNTTTKPMADIAMCNGIGCPVKEQCHRHTAIPNEYRQSYFVDPPLKDEGRCDYFWSNGKPSNQIQTNNDRNQNHNED